MQPIIIIIIKITPMSKLQFSSIKFRIKAISLNYDLVL